MTSILLLLACTRSDSNAVLRVSHVGSDWDGTAHAGITLDDEDGRARSWDGASVDVEVSTREGSGEWTAASDVTWSLDTPAADHVVIVADNSGSVVDYDDTISAAVTDVGASALDANDGNAVGLVRVSTEATVLSLLGDDSDAFADAATGLHVSNGWTALYDGVRFGSDVLTLGDEIDDGESGVCLNQSQHNILVFTDGRENNSQDEHATSYPGDGIDTTLDDLSALVVHGTTPAIHSIAIGVDADDYTLQELAGWTGGTYRRIDDYSGLLASLQEASVDMAQEIPVCFEVASCDDDHALITVTVTEDDGALSITETEIELPELCTEGSTPKDDGGCTHPRHFWEDHAGGSAGVTVGSESYTPAEILDLLDTDVDGDASLALGRELIVAKLNIENGANDSAIAAVIQSADAWLTTFSGKLPNEVQPKDASDALVWASTLDDFNNGVTGPGHCE